MSASGTRVAHCFEFGPYRLDPQERLLSQGQDVVRISPKVFDLLLLLVGNSGHLVEKAEMRSRLWPDTFVDETNLAQHVSMLRKALHDGEGGCRYLETVPRRGYRFVAPVREVPLEGSSAEPHAERAEAPMPAALPKEHGAIESKHWSRSSKLMLAFLAATLVIATVWAAVATVRRRSNFEIKSIAVLPLTNLSGDAAQDYFAEGMTDALVTDLSRITSLRVISRGSVMRYKQSNLTPTAIGRALDVDAVVAGAVVRSSDRVRITAQLIRTSTGENIWAQAYDRNMRDIVVVQDEVATGIAEQIRPKFTGGKQEQHQASRSVNGEAHEACLKGRYFWNRRTESGYLNAIRYFEEAIGRDPQYAPAYAGLADAYALLGSLPNAEIPRDEAMPRARQSAEQALQLDDSLAEAHTSLAFVKMHYDWDWSGAEHEFQRAIALNPNYATAHHWHAYNLVAMNRLEDAVAEIRRARALDPLSPIINTDLAELLFYARRHDEALKQAEAAVALDPSFPLAHYVMERIYVGKHMFTEAVAEGERALELAPDSRWMRSALAQTYALVGRTHDARNLLRELVLAPTAGPRNELPGIYAALGDRKNMFAELDKLYASREGGLIVLNYDPSWDAYRSDRRFQDLVRRVGLPVSGA